MKPYIYAFLFAFFLLFLKAFYFDAWYKTKYVDNNVSFEENNISEQAGVVQDDDFSRRGMGIEKISPEEALEKNEGNLSKIKAENPPLRNTGMYDKEKMPIEKLGDGIANTLNGKISN